MTKQILRDGERYRVPLTMMDEMQKDIREQITADTAPLHVVDAAGNAGLALNKPGARYLTAGKKTQDWARIVTANVQRDQAKAEMINDMQTAWQQDIAGEFRGAQPGDPCTVRKGGYRGYAEGSPGHLDDNLECIPDQKQDADPREVARVHTDGDERSRAWMDQVTDLATSWSRAR